MSAPLSLVAGCGGLAPAGQSVDQTFDRARALAGSDEILVVAWPLSARKALESELGRSPVAVSVAETGELSLQTDCRLDGRYAYHGVTAAESTIRISQTEGMGAGLPALGGVQVAAGASRDGQGRLHRVQVGRFALDVGLGLSLPETPACVGVTHVVESADVGAFTMSGQEARSAGGGVSAAALTAEAGESGASEEVVRDGDASRCAAASVVDVAPPAGCGALLSIRLRPFVATDAANENDEPEVSPAAEVDVPALLIGRWHSTTRNEETDAEGTRTITVIEADTAFLPNGSTVMEAEMALDLSPPDSPPVRLRQRFTATGEWHWSGQLTEKHVDLRVGKLEVFVSGERLPADKAEAFDLRAALEAALPIGRANLANLRFIDADHLEIEREDGVEKYERR